MENPYVPESQIEIPSGRSRGLVNVLIALVSMGVITANYMTATAIPRELWDVFTHVVFLVAPVSLLIHVPNFIASFRGKEPSKPRWWILALLLIPASFLVSISPYFSSNPFEEYIVLNRFFGPFSWMFWTWLIVLGILPFLELIPTIRRSRLTVMLLSMTAIGFQIHNASLFWWICHREA